ncbi:MAG: hypothetical protein AAB596_02045 [Patescibacteria group bacterium]
MQNKKNLIIIFSAVIFILITLGVLGALGIIKFPFKKSAIVFEEPDANLMTVRNAYDIAFLRAREWQADAKLADMKSFETATGPNGRSDNWNLLFISPSIKKKGFKIEIINEQITTAEEIFYTGTGAELPENIISSKEAITQVRAIKGYENEPIISVEMLYDPSGKWYWGIKTSKGVVSVRADR